MKVRDLLQEVVELGPSGTAFRIGWELKGRLGKLATRAPKHAAGNLRHERSWFADRAAVAPLVEPHVAPADRQALIDVAEAAAMGRVRCFSAWEADFGQPIDWHLDPRTGGRWPDDVSWAEALRGAPSPASDVKHTWEIGRFPQAFHLVRAGMWSDPAAHDAALTDQVASFRAATPYGRGIHWASSQEIAFRLLAWVFALSQGALQPEPVAEALHLGAAHTEQHIDYARRAVHNNHHLSEALLLLMAGTLLDGPDAPHRRALGREHLDAAIARQFYADGGYIQQSHNYHRLALQVLLCACRCLEQSGEAAPAAWRDALRRSLAFLHAHQNDSDGRLPNYGFNDGGLPLLLSICDYADFRPTLQALSIYLDDARIYPAGPWDEEAAWLLGPDRVAKAELHQAQRTSRCFSSGHAVIRQGDDSFATFRCGSLRDRFSQMDMLHVDVWWRGLNVLCDAGSYQYNGEPSINAHFMATASHNTVTVDGHDQMVHHRRFKVLYWTRAAMLAWSDTAASGEHYGFERHGCVHRRSLLSPPGKSPGWIVVDTVHATAANTPGRPHQLRLQWLAGYPCRQEGERVVMDTPAGALPITVVAPSGLLPIAIEQGWLSRHYGQRDEVPSLVVSQRTPLPSTLVTAIGVDVTCADGGLRIDGEAGPHWLDLRAVDRGALPRLEASA